jgi:hypothetical protein
MMGTPSIFKLPQFAEGPTREETCALICLENWERLPAGTLRRIEKAGLKSGDMWELLRRHVEEVELKPGDTLELITISTGTINSTGVEGDEDDKLYKLQMYPPYAKTSEYLGQYHNRASMVSP